ncbi:class I SAM-dependent methyltransferase [Nocardioides sp.]|uniref:class I SAM-dependent DNA methyltransferase n=1 Tax=Nocardioides sp. TaxID=35761 RepID=UPI00352741DB
MTTMDRPPFAEVYAAALTGDGRAVVGGNGDDRMLPVLRWLGPADDSDMALLAHCRGRTLDIGCGPGRMSAHLASLGHAVVGLDLVPAAVAQTRARGVPAVQGDVFGPVPHEGDWDTALLADGNIGIGGDPVRLLRRVVGLLAVGGRVVADLAAYGSGVRRTSLTIRTQEQHSEPFPWAIVGADAVAAVAEAAGLVTTEVHEHAGRWFGVLEVAR